MQPAASLGNDGNATVRRMKGGHNDGLGPGGTVNDEEFWSKKVQDVPATQVKYPLRRHVKTEAKTFVHSAVLPQIL